MNYTTSQKQHFDYSLSFLIDYQFSCRDWPLENLFWVPGVVWNMNMKVARA